MIVHYKEGGVSDNEGYFQLLMLNLIEKMILFSFWKGKDINYSAGGSIINCNGLKLFSSECLKNACRIKTLEVCFSILSVLTHCVLSSLSEICLFFPLMRVIGQSGVCYLSSAPLCPNRDKSFRINLVGEGDS